MLSLCCGLFSGSYCGGGFDVVGSPVLLSPSFQRQRCLSESDYSSMSESSKSEVCSSVIPVPLAAGSTLTACYTASLYSLVV